MAKTRIVLIVLGALCVIFAVNSAVIGSELKAEKAKAEKLTIQLSDAKIKCDEQTKLAKDLQYSLNSVRKEAEDSNAKIAALTQRNQDLEARLNAASEALQGTAKPLENPAKDIPEVPEPGI